MRVDFEQLLPLITGSPLGQRFQAIAQMEKYTLLTPPYAAADVKELALRAQKELEARLPNDYFLFLKCCDGGWLFTNRLYSIYAPEDADDDLGAVNTDLWAEGMLPEDRVAIGETNYGAYIALRRDGGKEVVLWEDGAETPTAVFPDFYAWLDDAITEAKYLLKEGGLPEITDPEEDENE